MSEEEIVKFLKTYKPGSLPASIFYEYSRLFYMIAADIVVFNKNGWILLTKRAKNDPFWPNALHIPGKIVIGSDKNYDQAVKRVIANELPGVVVTKPVLVGSSCIINKRGKIENKIFIAKLIKNNGYKFYNPKNLPKNTLEEVPGTLNVAVSKIDLLK